MFGEIRDAYYKCKQQPLSGITNVEAPKIPKKPKPAMMEVMDNKPFMEAMNNPFLEQIKLAQAAAPVQQQRPVVSQVRQAKKEVYDSNCVLTMYLF